MDEIIQKFNSISLPKNPIVVFDIDDTLLINGTEYNLPIIQAFHYIRSKGIDIAIITARSYDVTVMKITLFQLEKYNLTTPIMYFRPSIYSRDSYGQSSFKLDARKDLHKKGYTVIMSIGDMPWDIGDYGGVGILL